MAEQRERFEADLADYYERMELNHIPDFTGRVINQSGYDVWVYKNPVMNNYHFGWKACEAPLLERIAELETKLSVAQSLYEESCDKSYDFGAMQCRIAELDRQLAERKFVVELPKYAPPATGISEMQPLNGAIRNAVIDEAKAAILAAGGEVR